MDYRIVFMGSPDFAVPVLNILAARFPIVGAVTQPDRPVGRGGILKSPAVKHAAIALGIPVIQPERLRHPDAMQQIITWSPDVIVVAAFGQILRTDILELPPHGCINVHGSLLPRWRGAAPIQASILAGDLETGITIMKMDPGIDTGPILGQRSLRISSQDTGDTLSTKLSILGAQLLLDTLPAYLDGKISPQKQPEMGISYAPMLKKEDGLLDFNQSAVSLERRVRAMIPWPEAYFLWNGTQVKVLKASVLDEISPGAGITLKVRGCPAVGTAEGILILEQVQPAGKRPMAGTAFLAGARAWKP